VVVVGTTVVPPTFMAVATKGDCLPKETPPPFVAVPKYVLFSVFLV
jgi:hypothetical protein